MLQFIVNLHDYEDGVHETFILSTKVSRTETEKLLKAIVSDVKTELPETYTNEDLLKRIQKNPNFNVIKIDTIKLYF